MYPTLHIGPAAIQTMVVLWFAGLWLGMDIASRTAARRELPHGFVDSALFWSLIAGVIAARLAFVIQYPESYRNDWMGLVSPQPESLNGMVGLIAGAGVMAWLAWRAGAAFRPLLDALAPGVGIMLAAIALAQLAEGSPVGLASDVPWAVDLWDATRHPVQLYIALPLLIAVGGVWFWRGERPFAGFDALLIGGVYALAVLVSSRWYESSTTVFDDFRREQVLAWIALLVIAVLGVWWSRETDYDGTQINTEQDQSASSA